MSDSCFAGLLSERVSVRRPQVGVSSLGSPRSPVYELVSEDIPCCLQPLAEELVRTVAGKMERSTHVAYLAPADIKPGDVLVDRVLAATLAADAAAGESTVTLELALGLQEGQWVEIGDGADSELRLVTSLDEAELGLDTPLGSGHESGSAVTGVVAYEVVGVRDEAGRGHHLRVDLKRLRA